MADILIAPGSTMPNAPVGEVTLFLNTENGNILSYIDENGIINIYNAGSVASIEECCSCEIAKKLADSVTCALESGLITSTEFNTIVASGFSVVTTEVTNPTTGTKTCTVEIGPKNLIAAPLPTSITVVGTNAPGGAVALSVAGKIQLAAIVNPVGANQLVSWISANPLVATVDASGNITAVSIGTTVVKAVAVYNPSVFTNVNITVS